MERRRIGKHQVAAGAQKSLAWARALLREGCVFSRSPGVQAARGIARGQCVIWLRACSSGTDSAVARSRTGGEARQLRKRARVGVGVSVRDSREARDASNASDRESGEGEVESRAVRWNDARERVAGR